MKIKPTFEKIVVYDKPIVNLELKEGYRITNARKKEDVTKAQPHVRLQQGL